MPSRRRSSKRGGLYVLGTERHESRRIDNQLRGRSGRQGDPGESRFYLSLEDDLMRLFASDRIASIMERLKIPDDIPIEAKMVSRAIERAQTSVEPMNFEIRKNVLKYDEVMDKQRQVIYGERTKILEGEDFHDQAIDIVTDAVRGRRLRIREPRRPPKSGTGSSSFTRSARSSRPSSRRRLRHDTGEYEEVVEKFVDGRHRGLSARARKRSAPSRYGRSRGWFSSRHRQPLARAPLRDGLPEEGSGSAR